MRNFLLLLILLVNFTNIFGQTFKYIGIRDGLNSRRVASICQGNEGNIWILTHKGISKYDGKNFYDFPIYYKGQTMLFYPGMNNLQFDRENQLWIYGRNGVVLKYNEGQETFDLQFDVNKHFGRNSYKPFSAYYFNKKNLFIFFSGKYLYWYNSQTHKADKKLLSLNQEIINITYDSQKDLYYIADKKQLFTLKINAKQEIQVQQIRIPEINNINFLYFDSREHKLLINTLLDGLYLYNPQHNSCTYVCNELKDININDIVPYYYSNKEVLIATDGGGIYKFNFNNLSMSTFLKEDVERNNRMNGNIIKSICIDSSKRIWVAVYPSGITVYETKNPSYDWYKHIPNNPNSIGDDRINGISKDSEQRIWVSTSNGVSCFTPQSGIWKNYMVTTKNQSNYVFLTTCEIESGKVLAAGYMSDIFEINSHTGAIAYNYLQRTFRDKSPKKNIRSLYKDNNILWVGDFSGIHLYDLKTHKKKQSILLNYPVNVINHQDSSNIWVGTIHGLYLYNKQTSKIKQFRINNDFDYINCIYTTPDYKYSYIGTYGNGLYVVNNTTNKVFSYKEGNSGLITDNIYGIVPNKLGDLIISAENSLIYYNRKHQTFVNWQNEQGLLPSSFNANTAINSQQGTLFFGTDQGIVAIPDSVTFTKIFSSQMVFDNFQILYKPIKPGDENSPLIKSLNHTDNLDLDYNQNTFSFRVSSINYDNPSNILYSWKLAGFYDEWTPPTSYGEIRYTNLSPGEYVLHVRSILKDTGQVLEERELKITVGRPFWLSTWAYIIYGTILIVLFRLFVRVVILKYEKRESAEKISFFLHTAHDVRTPLTLIKAPLSEILKHEKLSDEGLANLHLAIKNTDNLTELANNLLNFREEELYSSKVMVHKINLNHYFNEFIKNMSSAAEQMHLSLSYIETSEQVDVWMDTNKMNYIIRNIISNALKYTPSGGSVTITAESNNKEWTVRIKDTGIGIPKKDAQKMFRTLFRSNNTNNMITSGSGMGMLFTYRLVKQHAGNIHFESQENIGTTFILTFPLQNKRYEYQENTIELNFETINEFVEDTEYIDKKETNATIRLAEDAPTLLVVEDHPTLRNFIAHALRTKYQVHTAQNGKEAIDIAIQQDPDIIISDVMMPEMNGYEMCRTLKSQDATAHIPIILLTALADNQSMLEGIGTRADLYLTKPFDIDVVMAHIETILANRQRLINRFRKEDENGLTKDDLCLRPGSPCKEKLFMQQIDEIIHQNLGNDFNVDVLCAKMGMSRTSLYTRIKEITNVAPADYIRAIRMKEAARLLRTRQYSVSEISDRLGISDPKYFTDVFKKYYGMTPTAYINQHSQADTTKV